MMHLSGHQHTKGFTIVELLIVIVVIGILAAITIVSFNGVQDKARVAVVQSDLNSAAKQLDIYKTSSSSNGIYPTDAAAAGLVGSNGTIYDYIYYSDDNTYCVTATNQGVEYKISSQNKSPTAGACPASSVPAGYETAPVAPGRDIGIGGYSPIQPSSCPSNGGSWIKVPGNTLYGLPNGFCVQQYPATNVGGVATSQSGTANRWTGLNQPTAASTAAALGGGAHLLSEQEWMTIAANAAMQPQNWSGSAVGNGTLPRGSSTSLRGGVTVTLTNGENIYFDSGGASYNASKEWTCYTGTSAVNCGVAGQHSPAPNNAYFTDQFNLFTSYGAFEVNGDGRYYGDPRFANPSLGTYVNSSRTAGLGYLRSIYTAGSSTVYALSRGSWTSATSSGLFTMYMDTLQTYQHATYGFRAAK